jgi:hypothetical protein
MTDDDPNEAYEVVPIEPGPNGPPEGWWTVMANVRYAGGGERTLSECIATSQFVKGFGRRPIATMRLAPGRRPKASSEGTRVRLGRATAARYGDLIARL